MNEDFGVGRHTNNPKNPFHRTTIDPDKYQSMSQIRPQQAGTTVSPHQSSQPQPTMNNPLHSANTPKSTHADISLSLEDHQTGSKPEQKLLSAGQGKWERFKHFLATRTKKQWIIFGAIAFILTAGIATTLALVLRNDAPAKTTPKNEAAAPAPVEKPKSPLTGIEVSEEDTKRPVIGVMIENSTFARPQSGLKDAGVVYEAIAEYGITRFLALFQEANPGNIGPVRSARPYYVDWAHAYDAAYAHVGGSPDALAKIKTDGVRDLDQFYNSSYYHRVNQREAPHNVYTSMDQLRQAAASKGWTSSKFTPLARKKEAPAKTVTANSIDIAISGPTYNVHYDYDAPSNSYLRTMGGEAHIDADSKARIAPKVVIALATNYSVLPDGYHSSYETTGTGDVKVFQDGTVTPGAWFREGNDNYTFKDTTGKIIDLDPGQTWITLVGKPADVTYTAPAPAAAPTP
jgi:hypothetical protein